MLSVKLKSQHNTRVCALECKPVGQRPVHWKRSWAAKLHLEGLGDDSRNLMWSVACACDSCYFLCLCAVTQF
jgi:hypothetical protein